MLQFRSPKERTPDFYQTEINNLGEKVCFRSSSHNKKQVFNKESRFHQYINRSGNGCSVSAFVGPGSYNDQEDFLKLTAQPCSIKLVPVLL
jgi:hypothetical protein